MRFGPGMGLGLVGSGRQWSNVVPRLISHYAVRYRAVARCRRWQSTVKPSHFMENIAQRCYGCATPFQVQDRDAPGYNPFVRIKEKPESIKIERDNQVSALYEGLDKDKREYLEKEAGSELTGGGSPNSAVIKTQQKTAKKNKLSTIYCEWCRNSVNGKNTYLHPPMDSRKAILKSIPDDATIVHVFDAMDFPTSVDLELATSRRTGRVLWVMNRADRIVPDKERAQSRLLHYVRDELDRLAKIPRENVFAISSNYDWFVDQLYRNLSDDNYLVGYTNVGKSTLALYMAHKYRATQYGRKYWGMGSWANPWITQLPTSYELKGGRFLTDLPSYPEPGNGTYSVLKPKLIRKLTDGERVFRTPGLYNSQRVVSVNPRQVISIGGVVALQRDQLHLIAWSIYPDSNYKTRVLGGLDKVVDMNKSILSTQERWSMVNPEHASDQLEQVMEFRFKGEGASLAIRGIGVVHLHVSGKIPDDGILLKVYALPNVKVMRRTDVMPYIKNPPNLRRMAILEHIRLASSLKKKEVLEKRRLKQAAREQSKRSIDVYANLS
jgi:hypothetical protein